MLLTDFVQTIVELAPWASDFFSLPADGAPLMGILWAKHYAKGKRKEREAKDENRRIQAENAYESSRAAYETRRRNAEADADWDARKASSGPEGASFIPAEVLYNDDPDKYAGLLEDAMRRTQGYATWMENDPIFNDVTSTTLGNTRDASKAAGDAFAEEGIRRWQEHQRGRQDLFRETMAAREAERQRRWEAADDVYQADRDARDDDLARYAIDQFTSSLDPGIGKITMDGETYDWAPGSKTSNAKVGEKQRFVNDLYEKHNGDWDAVLADPLFIQASGSDSASGGWLR